MTVKEQLSASKEKIVLPNKTLVGVEPEKKKGSATEEPIKACRRDNPDCEACGS